MALLPPALLVVGLVIRFGYSPAQTLVICLFGLGRAVESMSDIYFGFQQKQERVDLPARLAHGQGRGGAGPCSASCSAPPARSTW
ncbi:MAG: hypothetical protein IPJ24_04790 [bacterium]|nr:hypothetical protein [bacterium]